MSAQNLPESPVSENINSPAEIQTTAPKGLSDSQLRALDMLVGGAKFSAIARDLNIDRRTLYFWRKHDLAFIAELERRRTELYEYGVDRFRNLAWLALDRLESQIRNQYEPISMQAARAVVTLARFGQVVSAHELSARQKTERIDKEPLKET